MSSGGDDHEDPRETVTSQQWADLMTAGGIFGLLVIPLAKVLVRAKDRALGRLSSRRLRPSEDAPATRVDGRNFRS